MDTKTNTSDFALIGIVLSGLAMSVGWGFRGNYGHEAGAMIPGLARFERLLSRQGSVLLQLLKSIR